MHSYEARKRAVELYVEYNYRAADVIIELGYPSRRTLSNYAVVFTLAMKPDSLRVANRIVF